MRAAGAIVTTLCLPLLLYISTAAPGVTFIDSGELAAVAATLGIAHPTGYPLFTLLGRLATALPGPLEPITRLTLLSGLWVSFAVALFFFLLRGILATTGIRRSAVGLAALGGSLTLAGAATVWSQAVVVEVYALGFLFLILLLLLAMRMAVRGDGGEILFAYVAGLAVANHGSVAPLVPALALPLLARWGLGRWSAAGVSLFGGLAILTLPVNRVAGLVLVVATLGILLLDAAGRTVWRRLLWMTVAAVTGLTIYLYLPIRSALDPALDWGDPERLVPFMRHITGKVYHVWFLSSWGTMVAQLGQFGRQLATEMTPLTLPPMVAGVALLWRRRPVLAQLTLLVVLLNLLYATNYDIHDIATYFLPTIAVAAIWIAVTLGWIADWILRQGGAGRITVSVIAVLLLPGITIALNHGDADQHRNHLVEDYTEAMFESLEPDAILLSRQWDTFCSAALYEQLVRDRRPDVTVIEKELMRRSWYLSQLERSEPTLVEPCAELMTEFRATLVPFETDGAFDAARLQRLYVNLIHCLLESGESAGRPIYLTPDARTNEAGLAGQFLDVPVGLAMRLHRGLPDSIPPIITPTVRGLGEAANSSETMPAQLAALVLEMMTRRAMFEIGGGHREEARALLEQVLEIAPDYRNARLVLQQLDAQSSERP